MTDTTTTKNDDPTDPRPQCGVCGSVDHPTGQHDNDDPTTSPMGQHDNTPAN